MHQWLGILKDAVLNGVKRPDRTGVGTWAVFGHQLRFDLQQGFPAVTTKKLAYRSVTAELAAFIHGASFLADFHKFGCHIWDDNGNAEYWLKKGQLPGWLGRIYGVQWRDWTDPNGLGVDQLRLLVDGIKADPYGRRHIVTAWNPGELDMMCLPPCHVLFQCFVQPIDRARSRLDLRVDMRSVDLFLGLPFDIASYATLQTLIAMECGMVPGELVFQMGDAHVYCNHLDQVMEVIHREPCLPPELEMDPATSLFNFHPDHANLVGYKHHGVVSAPMNV